MSATATFSALATKCRDAYVELVLTSAQGGEVDPDDALRIAMAAGRSAPQLRDDVETAAARFERSIAFQSRDWPAEIEAARVEYLAANQAVKDADAAAEKARLACRTANERSQAALARTNQLREQQQRSQREYSAAMAATAGSARDSTDWRNFRLA